MNPSNPIKIVKANLNNSREANDYSTMLNSYAMDTMGQGKSLTMDHLQKVVRDLAIMPNASAYLAYVETTPIGFATCFSAYSTFRAKPLLNIHDIAVIAEYRGQGIGRMLLRDIAEDAKQMGYAKITLEVREDNPLADSLYRSEGYQASSVNGEMIQHWFLEKLL